jgi:O-antigen/teichoic acid export membrane protein
MEMSGSAPDDDAARAHGTTDAVVAAARDKEAGVAAATRETSLAARNAVKLVVSLLATLLVTVSVRFWLPRLLGPEVFGQVAWAESLAILAFLIATLGIDTYIAKEHATRVAEVEQFLGGLLIVRASLGLVAIVGMLVTVEVMGKDTSLRLVVVAFGLYELLRLSAETIGGVMNTSGKINRVALARPLTKLVWGVIVVVGMLIYPDPLTVGIAFLLGEIVRFVVFTRIMRHELGIRFLFDIPAAVKVVVGSMGFFINYVIHHIYGRIDVQMISVMGGDTETGYYGAASNLTMAGFLFLPVVQSVVLPMAARISAADAGSMSAVMRQGLRLVILAGTFPSLILVLHSDLFVSLVFGDDYQPSALALGTLGFLFPLTYAAVIISLHLIQLGKIWAVTRVSLIGLVVNPTLNYFLIPLGLEHFGAGGAGLGAGIATVVTEGCIVVGGLYVLGREGVDRILVLSVMKLAFAALSVVAFHFGFAELSRWRIPLEAVVFFAILFLTGGLPPTLFRDALAVVRRRGRGTVPKAPTVDTDKAGPDKVARDKLEDDKGES